MTTRYRSNEPRPRRTSRLLPVILVAAAACLLVGYLAHLMFGGTSDNAPAAEAAGRLQALEANLRTQTQNCDDLKASLAAIGARLDRLELRHDRQPLSDPSAGRRPDPTAHAAEATASENNSRGQSEAGKVSPAEFRGLMTKCLRTLKEGTASEEEQARFWQAARTTNLVADTIKDFEARVKDHPQDAAARMELADAYVAKLLTVPGGPERGIWGAKAEKQWSSVLEQDPDHWEAQYTLAYNYSMYPDFLNKADDAIQGFERALRIQQRVQPKPEHAKTYVQLARMYLRKGKRAKARETLETGQIRHPQDPEIQKAIQGLQDK